ncbi:MAG TPA: hypothetical protein VFF81_11675 [Noviherbaspirillum sp.]|nr:hypothetical protein [Noviherbaspirillum sp.]
MKWIVGALLVLGIQGAFAQSQAPIEIGTVNGIRFAVSSAGNQRIGNAALVRLLTIQPKEPQVAFAQTILVACDGSWISSNTQFAAQFNTQTTFAELERFAKSRDEAIPLSSVRFESVADSSAVYAPLLAKRAGQICKSAGRETRNTLIPVASYTEKDDIRASSAIVLGTSVKRGDVIDVWTRTTWYKEVPILDANGFAMKHSDGETMTNREATGKFSLDHTAYDCRNRTNGTYEQSQYEKGNSTPVSKSMLRERLRLTSVVPGSVGESELEAVCRLYGSQF